MTKCDKIVIAMDNYSTKKTNTIPTNATSTTSINRHSKKSKRYILHTVLLAIFLLLIVTIICYHYAKQKDIIQKWKVMKLQKFVLKIVRVIISIK